MQVSPRWSYTLFTLVLVVLWLAPGKAAAQAHPSSIHVLEIDSDDADDQAEALTGALRSRVRTAPGWTLLETTQSLSMLTAALRCPQRPDAACLQRIAEQLKTDRFMWGVMNRSAGHQVTAEVHLWAKGKPDQTVKESYSDNLKDQNDDNLRKVAVRIFDRLTGASQPGTVVVSVGSEEGAVFVDGEQKAQLDHGRANVQLPPGAHTVEVRGPNVNAKQSVTVPAGGTVDANFAPPAPPPGSQPPSSGAGGEKSSSLSGRKILEWGLIGGGGVLLVVGGIEGLNWLSLNSKQSDLLKSVPGGLQPCDPKFNNPGVCAQSNQNNSDAKTASTIALITGGAGLVAVVAGVYLLVTDHPSTEAEGSPRARLRVLPRLSPHDSGVDLSVAF